MTGIPLWQRPPSWWAGLAARALLAGAVIVTNPLRAARICIETLADYRKDAD